LGENPENSGTEVSTHLLTIELSDFFLRKKQFWSNASVRLAEHDKSTCYLQASVEWFEKTNKGLLVGFQSSHLSFAAPPNFHCVWLLANVNR